jgi:hypothetical protein
MIIKSGVARRAIAAAAITCGGAFTAALLAACGSVSGQGGAAGQSPSATPASSTPGSGSGTGSPTAPAGSAARAPGSQCPTSALRVTVVRMRGGAAAGTSYVPIDFTNVSSHSCAMYGFPGVSFVTGHPGGSQIGDAAARQLSFGSVTVMLSPGGTAHAWLGIADAGNYPASTCHPVTAHWLRIYPPDQYSPAYVSFTSMACSAKIAGSSPLSILPIRPGQATAQHVP